jgi:aminoglycoside phosphotransferase (APT) family kinase protein
MGGRVVRVRVLRGGTSSAVHGLRIVRPDGGVERAVLRRYVRPELNAEEPDLVAREERALRLVTGLPSPTPSVLAVDTAGETLGVPALLMTWLPGRVDWSPPDMDAWLDRLVALLPPVHALPLPPSGTLPPHTPYGQKSYEPPPWAADRGVWERAVELFHGPPLDPAPAVIVHRDFHPGNVLWRRGRVSGLVDWQSASIGPPSVDVGHCRMNLARYGVDVVDGFTARWEGRTGDSFHPWCDITTIIGALDGLRDGRHRTDHVATESVLARALAALT